MKWLCIISGVMAFLAIFPWVYEYYQVLRIVLCVSSAIIAYDFYSSKLNGWALAFVAIAILFNPISPVYMTKASWVGIDLITAVLFFIASQVTNKK
jgi:hypothetical protein